MSQSTFPVLMEVEDMNIFTSKNRQGTLNQREEKQDSVLDQVKKKLKDRNGEQKSLPSRPSQGDQEVNPEKFNGPGQKPKTANKAFGSLSDFLLFFENRNPEIKEFVMEFQEIEKLDLELSIAQLNFMIVPKIEKCLNEMFQKIKMTTKSIIKRKDKYAGLFTNIIFKTWEEFYQQVLRAYTINGFLYKKINKHLRNENWMQLDALLPYTYCLLKAFLWGPTGLTIQENFEALKGKSIQNKLILYRRADFDDSSLNFYDINKVKNFSWNGVTSTSLIESVTKKFQGSTLKRPVLIIIEIDFQDLQPEDLNALYLAKFSAYPNEEEVALPPGSIFELLKVNKQNPEIEVCLRLVTNVKGLASQGQFLHGMLQSIMRSGNELKIVCLIGKDLSRAIKHCEGNLLIENLEINLCHFSQKAVEIFLEVLPTMKNLASLMLNAVVLEEDCRLDKIVECLGRLKIKKLEILTSLHQENQVRMLRESMKYLKSLVKMKVTFAGTEKIDGKFIKELYDSSFEYLLPECLFELKIQGGLNIITKNGKYENFSQHLESLLKPQDINRNFLEESKNHGGVQVIEQIGQCLPSKKESERIQASQSRSFKGISVLRKREWNILSNPFMQDKTSSRILKELKIDSDLSAVRYHLETLKALHLSFGGCNEITNGDIDDLWNRFIKDPHLWTFLWLDFSDCTKISDQGLNFIKNIQSLGSLTRLHLNFNGCKEITDAGLQNLFSSKNYDFRSLRVLFLSFDRCNRIPDQDFMFLREIRHLENLIALHLSFASCNQMTDQNLNFLQGIINIKSLSTLYLNFAGCNQLTDLSLNGLQGLIHLRSLTTLSLSFTSCNQLTDQSLNFLQGIMHLKSLTALDLSFAGCNKLTDQSLNFLQEIMHLKSLATLNLSFAGCHQFTDQALNNLWKVTSKGATETHFQHSYSSERTTQEGVDNLRRNITSHLKSLVCLHLRFGYYLAKFRMIGGSSCHTHLGSDVFLNWPSDNSLDNIINPGRVRVLYLKFHDSNEMTDLHLGRLVAHLAKSSSTLTELHLDLKECVNITDEGFRLLCNEIVQYSRSLKNIFLCIPSASITEEFERRISNPDYLDSCTVIAKHRIGKSNLRDFNLKRSNINLKNDQNEFEKSKKFESEKAKTAIYGFKALSFSYGNKKYVLNEETSKMLRDEMKESLQFTFIEIEDSILRLKKFFFEEMTPLKSLRILSLSFGRCLDITDANLDDLSREAIQHLESLSTLQLDFKECYSISDKGLQNLCRRGIWYLKSLKTLKLGFDECCSITDKGLKSIFCQSIQPFELLASLHLSFSRCFHITDEGLGSLSFEGIQHLKSLETLYLNFNWCQEITDEGLLTLSRQGIQSLKSLKTLDLNFDRCENITDKGFEILTVDGFQQLQSLTNLTLSFVGCHKLTLQGLQTLNSEEMMHINLNFDWYNQIFLDKRLQTFTSEVPPETPWFLGGQSSSRRSHLSDFEPTSSSSCHADWIKFSYEPSFYTSENPDEVDSSLTRLLERGSSSCNKTDEGQKSDNFLEISSLERFDHIILRFYDAERISDPDLHSFDFDEWRVFSRLETFHFIFDGCKQLTGKGREFKNFCFRGMKNFRLLTTLYLSFHGCIEVTDEGIRNLCLGGIQDLQSLVSLHLSFQTCRKITNEGLQSLCHDGLKHLGLLKTLYLNFDECSEITDEGIKHLGFVGILHFKLLMSLHLSFQACPKITDEGLQSLCYGGLRHLKELEVLSLSFDGSKEITDEGIKNLCLTGIQNLTLLKNLHISFKSCLKITDEGMKSLCYGLKHLGLLENLNLVFDGRNEITDGGFQYLCQNGILHLKLLKSLSLNFYILNGLSDQGLKTLCSETIRHLHSLTSLKFTFQNGDKITEKGLKTLISEGMSKLLKLEHIELYFPQNLKVSPTIYKVFLQIMFYFGFIQA